MLIIWKSIPTLQRERRVALDRRYGDETRERLIQGEFGEQGVTWRLAVGKRHKYEVNEEGARRIIAFWQSQGWIGTADE